MRDEDNIGIETKMLGLREDVKAMYTENAEKDPMGEAFRAVESHAYNLKNVEGLREKYPEEYAARMQASINPPLNSDGKLMDSQWFAHSFAGSILKGVFDSDNVQEVEEKFGTDNLGVPAEFLELAEVQDFMTTLVRRPWANGDVCDYLQKRFNLNKDGSKVERYKINDRQFN